MKITVERDALKDALAVVVNRTKNDTIPILSHVLIAAKDNAIKLTGHDLDSCSQVSIPAEIETAGEVAIPGERFNRLIAGLATGSQVVVSADDKIAKVKAGRSAYQFWLLPADEFPTILTPKEPVTFTLTAKQIARLFKMPSPYVSTGKDRVYLQGIYLHPHNDRLAACATNGHVLLRVFIDVKPPEFEGIIIPDKSCDEFVRIAGDDDARIQITRNLIAIEAGDRRFVSKLIDGTFPEYERIIPQATAAPITVDTAELEAALARTLATIDPDRMLVIKLSWDAGVEHITASLRTDFGQGDEQIECDCVGKKAPGEVGAQIDYLRTVITAHGGERTRLYIDGPGEPIRIENPDDPDMVAVLMPCRV